MKDLKIILKDLKEFWVEDKKEFIKTTLFTISLGFLFYVSIWIAAILNGTV